MNWKAAEIKYGKRLKMCLVDNKHWINIIFIISYYYDLNKSSQILEKVFYSTFIILSSQFGWKIIFF